MGLAVAELQGSRDAAGPGAVVSGGWDLSQGGSHLLQGDVHSVGWGQSQHSPGSPGNLG